MPVVKVGAKAEGMNQVDGSTAQSVTGSLRAAGAAGVRGFLTAGDTAEYGIEITQAGRYEISIGGQRLDQAKGWQIHVGDTVFPLQMTEAERLVFGPASLTLGPAALRLSTTETSASTATDAAHQPIVSRISFLLRDKAAAAKPADANTTSTPLKLRETFTTDLSADWFWGLGTWTAKHPVIAEPKDNIGFGGDSGGPDGEKAGALEFRNLVITQP
jgi:hypothetical protein